MDTTVTLTVAKRSSTRPADMTTLPAIRCDTGWISEVYPCPAGDPNLYLQIDTAAHVVFGPEEVLHTTVDIFYVMMTKLALSQSRDIVILIHQQTKT